MTSPCAIIDLPVHRDDRGVLASVESGKELPFVVRREFHLFELRPGVARGGHSHKACHQFLVSMAGRFAITTDGGTGPCAWELSSPGKGLHVPPGHWVELLPLTGGAVLSVLASHGYDETDYIRDREAFNRYVHSF